MIKFRAVGNYVLVLPALIVDAKVVLTEDAFSGKFGIDTPNSSGYGTVISIGPGADSDTYGSGAVEVNVGDIIAYSETVGPVIKTSDGDCRAVNVENILGVLEDTEKESD